MQLHRAFTADWSTVKPADMNRWQRWAAQSGGYVTPGNAVTILGFFTVCAGLLLFLIDTALWLALALVLLGRLADLLDGIVADKTGTKSPIGEAMDVTIDKIVAVLTIVCLWVVGALPLIAFSLVIVHSVYLVALFIASSRLHERLHPSEFGKLAVLAQWGMLLAFGIAHVVDPHTAQQPYLIIPAYCLLAVFTYFGAVSFYRYTRQLMTRHARG